MKIQIEGQDIVADGIVVGRLENKAAAERLSHILFMWPHVCQVSTRALQIVVDLQKLGWPEVGDPDGHARFVTEVNFILDMLKREPAPAYENAVDKADKRA